MHEHRVQIYYEDTDHSGVVYHANYLKYFERAREHMLGTDELRRLFVEDGIGFAVYKAELTYKEGAVFGDTLVIESTVSAPTITASTSARSRCRWARPSGPETSRQSPDGVPIRPSSDCPT